MADQDQAAQQLAAQLQAAQHLAAQPAQQPDQQPRQVMQLNVPHLNEFLARQDQPNRNQMEREWVDQEHRAAPV